MPDIFISYKQEERSVAANLAARLTEEGYDVWWDAALLAGERFEDEIAEVLSASRAVVVLWSRKSVHSDWVKAEAESARMQRKVLPAIIDDLPPENLPLLFRGLHVTPLQNWAGEPTHAGFTELMRAVRERVGVAQGPALTPMQAEAKLAEGISEAEIWGAISASPDPSADEYRAYLKRFGPNARFADLAEIRIARIERRERGETQPPRAPSPAPAPSPVPPAKVPKEEPAPAATQTPAATLPPPAAPQTKARPALLGPIPIAIGIIVVLAIAVAGVGLGTGMFSGMLVPQDVRTAAATCADWSNSLVLDQSTGIPVLGAAADEQCEKAINGLPNDPSMIGLGALVRLEQGPDHAAEAKDLANRGIDLKSAAANIALGAMYEHGINFGRDSVRAGNYYRTAADLGAARAAAKLCLVWIDRGLLPDGTTADDVLRYCKQASDAGDALGQVAEGYVLQAGYDKQGVDVSGAMALYEKAADQGSPDGKLAEGALLVSGVSGTPDFAKAMSLFADAADAGYPEAIRRMAIMYELGQGVDTDVNHAGRLYEAASVKGDEIALLLASYGLPQGDVPSNRIDAQIDELTNNPTNPVGLRLLGMLYEQGYRKTADQTMARQQLQLCAAGGNSMCEFALGSFYHYDAKDDQRAAQQFQLSAAQGNLYGQYWFAYLLENGLGVPADKDKAMSYYQLAADQGHLSAINYLKDASTTPKN